MTMKGKRLPAAVLTVAAASLASAVFASDASAQCTECALHQDRDPFTQRLVTKPAPKPGGAVSTENRYQNPYNARAEMRGYRGRHTVTPNHRHY